MLIITHKYCRYFSWFTPQHSICTGYSLLEFGSISRGEEVFLLHVFILLVLFGKGLDFGCSSMNSVGQYFQCDLVSEKQVFQSMISCPIRHRHMMDVCMDIQTDRSVYFLNTSYASDVVPNGLHNYSSQQNSFPHVKSVQTARFIIVSMSNGDR